MDFLKDCDFEPVYIGHTSKNALNDFLIPALHSAKSYDRVAGYFSSASFVQTARGLSKFIKRGGKIRLVTSTNMTAKDVLALNTISAQSVPAPWDEFTIDIKTTAENYASIEEKFRADHVRAMCWLLASGQLEIKVVVRKEQEYSLRQTIEYEKFHPKFGILSDELEDSIVFSGSANETWLAWSQNVENISTYKSWDPGVIGYIDAYRQKFNDYWSNTDMGEWECVDLPSAIKKELLTVNEKFPEAPDLSIYEAPEGSDAPSASGRKPRQYQLDALKAWEDNDRVGILEMATGTGKTFTANLCIESANNLGSLLTIVVAPYQHIADQWTRELESRKPYQVGSSGQWRKDLQTHLLDSKLGLIENLTLVVVKNTAASEDFIQLTNELAGQFSNFLFVGDEVHWLGASTLQNALNKNANFRLGLSATPNRYFDETGTSALRNYFGEESIFEFDLEAALNWPDEDGSTGVLTPYEYHPIFVELNDEENESYRYFSKLIAQKKSIQIKTREILDEIERLQNLRADISKQAASKIPALHRLVHKLATGLSHTLIYCANTAQMESAIQVVRKLQIDNPARITSYEGASKSEYFKGKSEREHILSNFANGNHEVIFAIACLDEGVDIPSAKQSTRKSSFKGEDV
jgi:superfamily II DNA or RNA helicase